VIFGGLAMIGPFFRNYCYFKGYVMALRSRKVTVNAMYNKVGKLSLKSLARTNSGKLITLISGDLMTIEKPITMTPALVSGIILNMAVYVFIGVMYEDWVYVLIIAGMWIFMFICQFTSGRAVGKH
jgi:ABC-type multidrug transport system fused ATPase/permease subunit